MWIGEESVLGKQEKCGYDFEGRRERQALAGTFHLIHLTK